MLLKLGLQFQGLSFIWFEKGLVSLHALETEKTDDLNLNL